MLIWEFHKLTLLPLLFQSSVVYDYQDQLYYLFIRIFSIHWQTMQGERYFSVADVNFCLLYISFRVQFFIFPTVLFSLLQTV